MEAAGCGLFSASTTSGDIRAEHVTGESEVSSTSGEIILGRQNGDITVSTTSGDIRVEEVTGKSSVSTTSGEIIFKQQNGDIEASSTSGDIKIEELQGNFEMDSSSGEVRIANGTGQGRAETISGDVQIFLAELAGDLNISTTSGEVYLRLPETVSLTISFPLIKKEIRLTGNTAEGRGRYRSPPPAET